MSAETAAALNAAIEAHVADECGGLVSAWVLQSAYFNEGTVDRGTTGYFRLMAPDQPYHVGYGLATHLVNHFRNIPLLSGDEDD